MITSENMEITDLIDREFNGMGGRATVAELQQRIADIVPEQLRQYVYLEGITTKIKAFLRQKGNDGLAKAPAIDPHGTHVQLELLSVEEFEYVINGHQASSAAALAKARRYAEKCFDVHGVRIEIGAARGAA